MLVCRLRLPRHVWVVTWQGWIFSMQFLGASPTVIQHGFAKATVRISPWGYGLCTCWARSKPRTVGWAMFGCPKVGGCRCLLLPFCLWFLLQQRLACFCSHLCAQLHFKLHLVVAWRALAKCKHSTAFLHVTCTCLCSSVQLTY